MERIYVKSEIPMKKIHHFKSNDIAEAIKLGQPFAIIVHYEGNDVEEIVAIMKDIVNRPAQVPFVMVEIVENGRTASFIDVIERNSEWFKPAYEKALLDNDGSNNGCAWRWAGSSCCMLVKKWLLERGVNLGKHTDIRF